MLGYERVSNYVGVMQTFLKEKKKFQDFYKKEPTDSKTSGTNQATDIKERMKKNLLGKFKRKASLVKRGIMPLGS